jgi:CTP:molybdopterin cytidylyltransferase MocA
MIPLAGAIVPAAGRSHRMGSSKQLLDLGGTTVLARVLQTLRAAGIGPMAVVVAADDVAAEAARFPVAVVRLEGPEGDMAASVRAGLTGLPPEVSGVLVAPCDHPLVSATTLAALATAHRQEPAAVFIPCHGGRRGHPTLFPRALLAELEEGLTLRHLLQRRPDLVRHLETDDPAVLLDMDTPEDYQRLKEQLALG